MAGGGLRYNDAKHARGGDQADILLNMASLSFQYKAGIDAS